MSHTPGPHDLRSSNRSPALLAGSITLIAAATFAVILRLVARRIKKISWAADDLLAIVAVGFAYAMFTSIVFCIKHGLGKKRPTNISSALQASKWLYIFEALFPVTTIATKLSILYLYKRIFSTLNKNFAWALYTVGALQVAWAVSGFFTTVFQCWPIDILWRLEGGLFSGHPAGHCIDLVASLTGLAVINTVLNTALLVLPMPMVWKLHTSRKHKIALTLIFALGCADISAGIARTYLTSQVVSDPTTILWEQAPAVILSFVEPCVGIICACLPVMRPLLYATKGLPSRLFNNPFGSSSWIRLRGRASYGAEMTEVDESGGDVQSTSAKPGKASAVNTPRAGEPFIATMVQVGFPAQRQWMDEEGAREGIITVETEMNQSMTRL